MTKEGTEWQSVAQWPDTVSLGSTDNESRDYHTSEAAALAVVNMLKREGFGGEGKIFPIRAYVLPPTPPPPAGAETETPQVDAVGKNIGKLLAQYRHGPIGLTATANLIDDELDALRQLEHELTSLRRQAEADRETIAGLLKAEGCALELMDTVARGFDRCLGRILAGDPTGAERELRLAIARVDSPLKHDGKSIAQLRTQLASADKDRGRLKWLHTGSEKDKDGCEWGVFRVKWNAQGQPIEVWHTLSDYSDLDAAMQPSASLDHDQPGETKP